LPLARQPEFRSNGVGMYVTKSMKGVLAIQRDGRHVLTVEDQDWEFAHKICELLNGVQDKPEFLNEHDLRWLKAMDHAFEVKVPHA
jgi:hypothetical protein